MIQIIVAVFILLLVSGLCSGSEAALFSVSVIRVRQLAESGSQAAKVLLNIRENMNRPIASIVVLNNIANIVGSIVVGLIVTNELGEAWLGIVTTILTFLVIIFSEIIPKTLGEQYAEQIALLVARPVQILTLILTPIVWLVEKLTSPITKGQVSPTTNEAEIRLLARIGRQEGIIEDDESEMIERVFSMNDKTAEEMMTPRVAMTSLDGDLTLAEAKEQIFDSNHSRMIVIGETVDDVLGVALKDELLTAMVEQKMDHPVSEFARTIKFIPEKVPADRLLQIFRQSRQHIAVVMDEFGGVAGLVTLEDVLETLTGHIVDETDEYTDLRTVTRKRFLGEDIVETDVELIVDQKAVLGEGPCWDQDKQQLYWVDILQKQIHIYRPDTDTSRTIQLDRKIGTLSPRTQGGLIIALDNGIATLDLETEEVTYLADPETHLPGNRFNDGKCDPKGRFLAGTMDDNEGKTTGALYLMEPNHQLRQLFDEVGVSNGIGWSPNYDTMYYIDSPTREVVAFDYDLESGQLSNRRVIITISEGEGFPDGMTTDTEGMLWVALWEGESVTRWDPKTGKLLQRIPIPAQNVTACTFGGPELKDLYITTARINTGEDILEKYPNAGGLFRIKTDVVGMPNFAFEG